ncbi:MAG TPA: thioesterase family protein [Trichocoleus sp.]|jgi:1,4-dihydroxy-2-naphthoyl-CoA hydrolase
MPFIYNRTIHFSDTDAAGVVYFANVLSICHEAYEESLAAVEINLKSFFSKDSIAVPIVHASIDFLSPMFCGEVYQIHLTPQPTGDSKFEIEYAIYSKEQPDRLAGRAKTIHVCIEPATRSRAALPSELVQWLDQFGESRS